jgi:hypothetical protein
MSLTGRARLAFGGAGTLKAGWRLALTALTDGALASVLDHGARAKAAVRTYQTPISIQKAGARLLLEVPR